MAVQQSAMRILVLATVSVALGASSAQATDAAWKKTTDTDPTLGWGQTNYWQGGKIPDHAGDAARFLNPSTLISADVVIQSGPRTVGTLEFGGSRDWKITTNASAAQLTLAALLADVPAVIVHSGSTALINGKLTGANGFNLSGGGTLKLTERSSNFVPNISGNISVAGTGTTLVLGAHVLNTSGTAYVTVENGAKFAGSGTVNGTLTINGIVSPGDEMSTGTLITTGHQDWNSGGTYAVKLTNELTSDHLTMSSVTMASNFKVQPMLLPGFDPSVAHQWQIADVTSGNFSDLGLDLDYTKLSGVTGTFSLSTAGSALNLNYSAVPEATTMLLGAASVMPLLMQRRRQRGVATPAA